MRSILEFIANHKPSKPINYKFHPNTKEELQKAIETEISAGNTDLNCIDTSKITDMSYLFSYLYGIDISKYPNIDISKWDVSNVKSMQSMFYLNKTFNCDISKWDVSNVTDMSDMFYSCKEFNADISKWDVSNVKNTANMFEYCVKFNADISKWDVSNVKKMNDMFYNCPLKDIYGETPKHANGKLIKL